jgi:hypothetical protein
LSTPVDSVTSFAARVSAAAQKKRQADDDADRSHPSSLYRGDAGHVPRRPSGSWPEGHGDIVLYFSSILSGQQPLLKGEEGLLQTEQDA